MSKTEWNRRVKAALALHGLQFSDIEDLEGLPKNAARRAGHASDNYTPNDALAMMLAKRLELPQAWFSDEDWRPLVGEKVVLPEEAYEGLRRQRAQVVMLEQVLERLEKISGWIERATQLGTDLDRRLGSLEDREAKELGRVASLDGKVDEALALLRQLQSEEHPQDLNGT